MTKSRGINSAKIVWTDTKVQMLRDKYSDTKTADLAEMLRMKIGPIYQKAYALGLYKSAVFLASSASGRTNGRQGIGSRFVKGCITWNKGMKGLQYEASKATQFKPGQEPHNTHEIGSYRITKDGTLQRKISNDSGSNSKRWRGVHELVWIEANGARPASSIVVFKPNMRTNVLEEITINKVECITLVENMKRNTLHNLPKELSNLIQLRGALNRKINARTKQNEQ